MVAVARHHHGPLAGHRQQRLGGRRPVHGEAVAEVGGRAVLEQVAGAQDVGIGDRDHDVVVGVAAARGSRAGSRRPSRSSVCAVGEHAVRRIQHHLARAPPRAPGSPPRSRARWRSPVTLDHRPAPLVAPDHGGPEDVVAEGVVVVPVGVDDDADPRRAELAQVVEDLARLGVASCACPRPARRRRPARPRCPGRRSGSGGRTRGRRPPSTMRSMRGS